MYKVFGTYVALPKQNFVLSAAYGFGFTASTVAVSVSALVGVDLAPSESLATLPYGLQFLGVILSSFPSSMLMSRIGRKPVYMVGAGFGVLAGILGVLAVTQGSFLLLLLSHLSLGVMIANVGLFRFGALDMAPKSLQSKSVSLILFGGVFAALLGPTLARNSGTILPLETFAAAYASISILAFMVIVLVATIKIPYKKRVVSKGVRVSNILKNRLFVFAVYCGAIGYFVMNVVMISSSIEMQSISLSFSAITYVIQFHVFAMFAPSLFTGFFIGRFGVKWLVATGIALNIVSAGIAINFNDSLAGFVVALFLLGLGWNFMYTGGTYLVGVSNPAESKFKAQGINDTIIAGFSSTAGLSAGFLLTGLGWANLNFFAIGFTFSVVLFAVFVLVVLKPKKPSLKASF